MRETSCPICGSQSVRENVLVADSKLGSECECPRCGKFSIVGEAVHAWATGNPTPRQKANASAWIRERRGIWLTADDVPGLLRIASPSIADRADRLLIEISRHFPAAGEEVRLEYNDPAILSCSWSNSSDEVVYLLHEYLVKGANYLTDMGVMSSFYGHISPAGHHRLQEIRHSQAASNIGFCAMWFDEGVKPVWINAIEPAIRDSGYEAIRIDSHEHNNRIDDEILAMLRRSKFVVADFTGQRGGVYFEAGFALGLGLDVIWTCREDELSNIHFDNRQYSFVTWKPSDLPDLKRRLQNRIMATIGLGQNAQ